MKKTIFALIFFFLSGTAVFSQMVDVKIAADNDIVMLKKDLLSGKLKVGKTRLKEIKENYGEPAVINNTDKKVVYDYRDMKLTFSKEKYFRDWEYDYSHKQAYTDDIDNLRFDLEDGQLAGNLITFTQIRKDYDEPTEDFSTEGDGGISVYYYGEIKLTFENVIMLENWKGSNLLEAVREDVLMTK